MRGRGRSVAMGQGQRRILVVDRKRWRRWAIIIIIVLAHITYKTLSLETTSHNMAPITQSAV